MKRIMLLLALVSLLVMPALTYAEEYLSLDDSSGLTQEVVSDGGVSGVVGIKESSLAVDNKGNVYVVETWAGQDQIWVFDKDYNYYHGWLASAENGYQIKAIEFDHAGSMFCLLSKIEEYPYPPSGKSTQMVLVKISGFSSLQEELIRQQKMLEQIRHLLQQLLKKVIRLTPNLRSR